MQADTHCFCHWMVKDNLPAILDIERKSFEIAWTKEDFLNCIRQRHCIGFVAEIDQQIVGFFIYELKKRQIHLLNFAVHPDFRRQSVGRQMIEKLIRKLSPYRRPQIRLEVRETNMPAILFFQKLGFLATAVLPNYYEDVGKDAYRMKYTLPQDNWDDS